MAIVCLHELHVMLVMHFAIKHAAVVLLKPAVKFGLKPAHATVATTASEHGQHVRLIHKDHSKEDKCHILIKLN